MPGCVIVYVFSSCASGSSTCAAVYVVVRVCTYMCRALSTSSDQMKDEINRNGMQDYILKDFSPFSIFFAIQPASQPARPAYFSKSLQREREVQHMDRHAIVERIRTAK